MITLSADITPATASEGKVECDVVLSAQDQATAMIHGGTRLLVQVVGTLVLDSMIELHKACYAKGVMPEAMAKVSVASRPPAN